MTAAAFAFTCADVIPGRGLTVFALASPRGRWRSGPGTRVERAPCATRLPTADIPASLCYSLSMTGFAEDPQAPYGQPRDKRSFLHWVQKQECGRYEFKDGRIVMHPGSTLRHGRIIGNFVLALGTRLDPAIWSVVPTEVAVEIGEDIRYPDVLVVRNSKGDDNDVATTTPVVLVEVLSPSSVSRDLNLKLAEYTSLASLEAYIVASQDEPIVWVWQRNLESRAFSPQPLEVSGKEGVVDLEALSISLPLADVFRAIFSR